MSGSSNMVSEEVEAEVSAALAQMVADERRYAGSPWRPAKEAPRDGTEILGYQWYEKRVDVGDTYDFFNVVYWEKGVGWCLNDGNCIKWPITHWMPLPEPPEV